MKQSCDAGTAPAIIDTPVAGRKKKRRNRKNSTARIEMITTEKEFQATTENESHDPEITENDISAPPLSTPKEVFSGSVRTDISLESQEPPKNSEGTGIVYELAEEIYRREQTISRLEALCNPPFEKKFTSSQRNILDDEADERINKLTRAAAKQQRSLTFLPEGLFEDENKPISTLQAFILQLVMLIPALNIISAAVLLLMPHTNQSIRSFSRALLIWSGILMGALFLYFLIYYLKSEWIIQ